MCNFPGDLWLLLLVLLLDWFNLSVVLHDSDVALCRTIDMLHGFCGAMPVEIIAISFSRYVARISITSKLNCLFYRIIYGKNNKNIVG